VIREGLRALCDRGDLRRKANPEHLATALLATADGSIMLARVRRNPAPLETAVNEARDRVEDLRPRRAPAHRWADNTAVRRICAMLDI
jgi:TetR/AcrR family transcriptional repressor of nem operon